MSTTDDMRNTSDSLRDGIRIAMIQLAATARSDTERTETIFTRFIETLDDYVDARIAHALDRENNRGEYTRY